MTINIKKEEINMGDKGKKDKVKREIKKEKRMSIKEKRKLKKEKNQ